ncbi:hypothetical protein [uncultured Microbacterium sp.]|uniref:hypothetical protein n=1 Tax=uncultured Microbacterium sp. TaxID=191216 RepID=UPI0025CCD422|nr:hypothetical protein [uncultured Microbacterium sp.]
MEAWIAPTAMIIVALIGVSGVVAANRLNKWLKQREREDVLQRRVFVLINYADRLRQHIYRGDPPPPEQWPLGMFDQGGK